MVGVLHSTEQEAGGGFKTVRSVNESARQTAELQRF